MDALPRPVLSVWSEDGRTAALPPDAIETVPGRAATAREALARARDAFPGRDVLVLRADAVLPADRLRRLLAAWRDSSWDVLSPLDGRWPIFPATLDDAGRDALAWQHGDWRLELNRLGADSAARRALGDAGRARWSALAMVSF